MYRQKTQIFRQNDFRQISTRYRIETRIVPVVGEKAAYFNTTTTTATFLEPRSSTNFIVA